jgi:hypothetical protein
MGEIGLIKSFIHYVHLREKAKPIGNDWKFITMDDFDQFRLNRNYTPRFGSLSCCLPPLDMMYIDDVPNLLDVPDVCNVIDARDVTDTIDVINILDSTNVPDVTNISDDSHDLSLTSDISQVTTIREVLIVHHNVDMEYDVNGPVLLSSSSSPMPSRPPCKPSYPKQWCNINPHGMSAYEFLKDYVHEVETEVVPDDAITDDQQVDEVYPEPPDTLLNNIKGEPSYPPFSW